jgi:hypothetical protein
MHSFKEMAELKRLEDLLYFSSFASSFVANRRELIDLKTMMCDVVERWQLSQQRQDLDFRVEVMEDVGRWKVLSGPIWI